MIHILLFDLQSLDDPHQSALSDIIAILQRDLVVKFLCDHHLAQFLLLLRDGLLERGYAGFGLLDFGLVGLEEGAFLEAQLVGLICADVCDGFVRNAEGIFLGDVLIEHPLLQFQPILLLEVIVILRPSLMQMLHFTLDALLNLRLLLVQLPLQQFGAILNQNISIHKVELTRVGYFYDSKASLNLSLVVRALSELFGQHFSGSDVDLSQFLLHAGFWDHGGEFKLLLPS